MTHWTLDSIHAALPAIEQELARTAAERDKAGGHAAEQKELLRQNGLLLLVVPKEYGGIGASWSETLAIVRRIARVDSAMAHLLAFQTLQLSGVLSYGSDEQRALYLRETVALNHWWGNSANPADPRLMATEKDGGLILQGIKGFCSGTLGSHRLLTTALHQPSGKILIAVLPTAREGITIHDDWDPIGQRQTDSTSVSYEQVRLEWSEVLFRPDAVSTPFLTLRGVVAQLILVNLYLGMAEGAFDQARDYTLNQGRPWFAAGVQRAADDPYVIHRYAEMHLQIRAARALADEAGVELDKVWRIGPELVAEQRGRAALAVAEAKVLAHRTALAVGQDVFDVCGARATKATLGLDRFWRNARTHTLHDPIDYKLRDVGRYALEHLLPEPTLYS
ncbi:acyl-CoA dehydrogenase [Herbaspirillum sp. meg3]|jgi:alkylation response protein AidB-like acyl-CoA dehydrogenase|uniref:acyl-CoA dehydrogenase family protein n=1 Tax=Herbaspirillum sp. meg3 TaxID=2025949 RepID=UPI000B995A8F|nr:acyl-CoA dehydrogenase family protein [Herbaspirillum sp. meg3]ASU38454.1 acyl-CoA dehydrogenase [Herbaspirillum sp. meg3]